jgi:hypothetical protein
VSEKSKQKKIVKIKEKTLKREETQNLLHTGRKLHQNVIIFVSGLVAK